MKDNTQYTIGSWISGIKYNISCRGRRRGEDRFQFQLQAGLMPYQSGGDVPIQPLCTTNDDDDNNEVATLQPLYCSLLL